MESVPNNTKKWSLRRLFNNTPVQPRPRLLDESVIDRDAVPENLVSIINSSSGPTGHHTPIATLPEDLQQRVFLTYLDTLAQSADTPDVIKYSHARLHAPFLLSSVCRSWRAHALASPLLWTYVVVPKLVHGPSTATYLITRHIKRELKQFSTRWIYLLQLLLERSGQAGLLVVIPRLDTLFLKPDVAKEFQLHRKALVALASHRTRICSLSISTGGPIPPLIWEIIGSRHVGADGTVNLNAPHLEHLDIRDFDSSMKSPSVRLEAPQLRVCIIDRTTYLRPQCSHLLRLEATISFNAWEDWTSILTFCAPTLEHIHLGISNDSVRTAPVLNQPLSQIVFPRLTHFGITPATDLPGTLLSELFGTVVPPVLRSARFAAASRYTPTGPAFVQFVSYLDNPASGTIEELAIVYMNEHGKLDVDDARTIARRLPSVKLLTLLPRSDVAVGFLGAMHHLCPHTQIRIESAHVWLPISSPQEKLTVVVEAPEFDNGTNTGQRIAFFDVTRADRDYNTIEKTGNIHPERRCVIQLVESVVVVWRHGPVEDGEEGREHTLGPRYQILPTRLDMRGDSDVWSIAIDSIPHDFFSTVI